MLAEGRVPGAQRLAQTEHAKLLRWTRVGREAEQLVCKSPFLDERFVSALTHRDRRSLSEEWRHRKKGQRREWREDRGEDHDHTDRPNQYLEDEQPLARPIGEEQAVLVEELELEQIFRALEMLDTRHAVDKARDARRQVHRDAVGEGHACGAGEHREGPADGVEQCDGRDTDGQFFRPMLQEGVDDDRVAERVENRARALGDQHDGEVGGPSGCGSPSRPEHDPRDAAPARTRSPHSAASDATSSVNREA